MKPLHVGLLVVGAALAGGLAVRMAEPPPLPAPSHAHPVTISHPFPTPVVPTPAAAPLPTVRKTETPVAQVIAPAPPPIYSEPPHVEPSARRKPFGDPPPRHPVEVARAAAPPVTPVPYEPPAPAPAKDEPPHVAPPTPHHAVLEAGVPVTIRLRDTLSSDRAVAGDMFQATLTDPLIADGLVVAERGAHVTGRVSDARRAGRMTGASFLELRLLDVTTADGQRVAVTCDPWLKRGDTTGTVTIPSETAIRFRLAARVTITERRL